LDTPLEPVIGLAEGETRWRGMKKKLELAPGEKRRAQLLVKMILLKRINLMLAVQSPSQKYSCSRLTQITSISTAIPSP
jgi:hypothetical protein